MCSMLQVSKQVYRTVMLPTDILSDCPWGYHDTAFSTVCFAIKILQVSSRPRDAVQIDCVSLGTNIREISNRAISATSNRKAVTVGVETVQLTLKEECLPDDGFKVGQVANNNFIIWKCNGIKTSICRVCKGLSA